MILYRAPELLDIYATTGGVSFIVLHAIASSWHDKCFSCICFSESQARQPFALELVLDVQPLGFGSFVGR